MIDERALEAAIAEAREQHYVKGLHEDEEIAIIIAIITAYEAARPETNPWRPIEEALLEKTVLVCLTDCRDEIYMATRYEGGDWRFDTFDDELELSHQDLVERGAMFRTIEPPTQDAVSQALSTPPAAEEG